MLGGTIMGSRKVTSYKGLAKIRCSREQMERVTFATLQHFFRKHYEATGTQPIPFLEILISLDWL